MLQQNSNYPPSHSAVAKATTRRRRCNQNILFFFLVTSLRQAKANDDALNDYHQAQITHRNIINFVVIKMSSKHLF